MLTRRMLMALLAWLVVAPAAALPLAEQEVRDLLLQSFDRPDQPLTVGPITIEDGAAVAGWTQGNLGGRALLRFEDGAWRLVACAGDALIEASTLQGLGLSPSQAMALARRQREAEAGLLPERLRALASFNGLQDMRGDHAPHSHPSNPMR